MLSCPGHVNCASLVCKNWSQNLRAGVQALEVDVNPDNELWLAKVEQLQQLTPSLSSCKAHVSCAVGKLDFGTKIKHLSRKLHSIQVTTGTHFYFNLHLPHACMRAAVPTCSTASCQLAAQAFKCWNQKLRLKQPSGQPVAVMPAVIACSTSTWS